MFSQRVRVHPAGRVVTGRDPRPLRRVQAVNLGVLDDEARAARPDRALPGAEDVRVADRDVRGVDRHAAVDLAVRDHRARCRDGDVAGGLRQRPGRPCIRGVRVAAGRRRRRRRCRRRPRRRRRRQVHLVVVSCVGASGVVEVDHAVRVVVRGVGALGDRRRRRRQRRRNLVGHVQRGVERPADGLGRPGRRERRRRRPI